MVKSYKIIIDEFEHECSIKGLSIECKLNHETNKYYYTNPIVMDMWNRLTNDIDNDG